MVTAIYLTVFGSLGYWHLVAHKEQYFKTEQARLKAQLQALAPSLSISLQFGFTDSIEETVLELMSQNSELLAARVVANGETVFEHAKTSSDLMLLKYPTKSTIYAKAGIRSSITPTNGGEDYIESLLSDTNLNMLLRDYYRLAFNGSVVFAVALVIINLLLAYIFQPLNRLAVAMGEYDPKLKNLNISTNTNSPEIQTITLSAISMVERLEIYANEIIKKDRQMLIKLRQAQMGELLSMIAHQWRQPLSSIGTLSTNIQLLIELGKCEPKEVVYLAKKIDNHTAYLANTVSDFRNLYNPNKKPKETDLNEICSKAVDLMANAFNKHNIALEISCGFANKAMTYQEEILQVLMALLKNASDILVEREVSDPTISITGEEFDTKCTITVSDNGGGISAAILEKIYDPYFSTKDEKNGTGLGLYMAKMLVEEHCKGKLDVANSDKGAEFTITIYKEEGL